VVADLRDYAAGKPEYEEDDVIDWQTFEDSVREANPIETFGRLIGNTDLHFGNLAFRLDGMRVTSLAPVYDMLPMHYHPWHGELPRYDHVPVLGPEVADVALSALDSPIEFWARLAGDERASESFREIASCNVGRTLKLRPRVDALPVPGAG